MIAECREKKYICGTFQRNLVYGSTQDEHELPITL